MAHHEIRQRVEVDQAALMSKILTKYNTEFGMMRELIQNSDDAAADQVRITLDLDPATAMVQKVSVWNSGQEFSDADWKRVTKIAAGNPDASSVGLFGVGFYAVFSASDQPEILSGDKAMRFAFEDDGYCTYERALPSFMSGATVSCELRAGCDAAQWAQPDELVKLTKMLAATLMFSRSLASITLQRTGESPLILRRELTPTRSVSCEPPARPSGDKGVYNMSGPPLFAVAGRQLELAKLALWIEVEGQKQTSVELLQVRAELDVKRMHTGRIADTLLQLSKTYRKPMPDRTTLRLLYPPIASSTAGSGGGGGSGVAAGISIGEVFEKVCCADGDGRLYIGIGRTDQTTGCGVHVCGQFLPTMERTAVDLSDRDALLWNKELLTIAGGVAAAYYLEEQTILSGGALVRGEQL